MTADKIYTLYIPKYKGSESEHHQTGYSKWWPLPREIHRYLAHTPDIKSIIVAPGFLSARDNTTLLFLNELNGLIKTSMNGEREISVGILRGVNGFCKREDSAGEISGSNDVKVLKLHELGYKTLRDTIYPDSVDFTWTTMAPDPAQYQNIKEIRRDHAKLLFFIDGNLPKSSDSGCYSHDDYKSWLGEITVKAMVIGSSNFSYQTYFGTFDKSEADLLLFTEDPARGGYHEAIANEIAELKAQNSTEDKSDEFDFESHFAKDILMLSESILMYPDNPQAIFKPALDELLRRSMVFSSSES